MDEKGLPSADMQIMTRLENATRGVLLELESQGTAIDGVSGSFTVTITNGEISVSHPPVEVGRKAKALTPSTTE